MEEHELEAAIEDIDATFKRARRHKKTVGDYAPSRETEALLYIGDGIFAVAQMLRLIIEEDR